MTAPRYVVTGGTGALGQSVVLRLLETGASVAVPYRGGSGFADLAKACSKSALLWGEETDLSDLASVERFMANAARGGAIDGVAALAGGYAGSGTLEATPPSEWAQMLSMNLETLHATCRAALPYLLKSRGSLVTVSSRVVEAGGGGAASYAVSKAGVQALTRVLALENRDRGVRFNCIAPSTIDTPANRRAMPAADPSRWTAPSAIARVVAFLLSPESAPTSGAWIPL
jgi:NAD(P)-dependent dehydrogenase (short-subunit alcohol dehydrogenase family)